MQNTLRPSLVVALSVCLAACGGGGGGGGDPPATTPPPTTQPPPTTTTPPGVTQTPVTPAISMSASSEVVALGSSAELVWSSDGVTACTALGDWSGALQLSGNTTVRPTNPTNTYTVSCTGSNGSATKALTITVDDRRPVSVNLDVDLSAVATGTDVILSWASTGATQCTASGGWTGARSPRGYEIRRIIADIQFTLACSGLGGTAGDTADVTLVRVPTLSFRARKTGVFVGDTATLEWTSQFATACIASGGWSGVKPLTGTEVTAALTVDTVFGLTCNGVGGSITANVTVTVAPPPEPSLTFNATETSVLAGTISMLHWSSVRLNSCVATGDWSGAREPEGAAPVGPLDAPRSYTLSCLGPNGAYTKSIAIDVTPRPQADPKVALLAAEFVELGGRPGHEGWSAPTSEPVLDGMPGRLLVTLAGAPQGASATLVDDLGTNIATLALAPFAETPRPADFFADVTVPTRRFTVQITGFDSASNAYTVTSRQFNPVPFAVTFPGSRLALVQGQAVTLPVTVTNAGAAQNLRLEFTGLYVGAQARTIALAAGETRSENVVVAVPNSVQLPAIEKVEAKLSSLSDPSKLNAATLRIAVSQ